MTHDCKLFIAGMCWLSVACAKSHVEAPGAVPAPPEVGPAPVLDLEPTAEADAGPQAVDAAAAVPKPATTPDPKPAAGPKPAGDPSGACSPRSASTLAGLSLHILAKRCSYSVAELSKYVETPYELRIERPLAGVKPYASGEELLSPWPSFSGAYRVGCGEPQDASNLMVAEWVRGPTGSLYCMCDFGRCAPNQTAPKDVQPRSYEYRFRWIGKSFRGPSDTGEVPGAGFVPGSYELSLRVDGSYLPEGSSTRQPFHAEAVLPITVTP